MDKKKEEEGEEVGKKFKQWEKKRGRVEEWLAKG